MKDVLRLSKGRVLGWFASVMGWSFAHVGHAATLVRVLQVPSPESRDQFRFGSALAVVGDDVLVGAPGPQSSGGANLDQGRAYLIDGATGLLLRTFSVPGSDDFGRSVAAEGGSCLIGASGAAHVFDCATGAFVRSFTVAGATPSFGVMK